MVDTVGSIRCDAHPTPAHGGAHCDDASLNRPNPVLGIRLVAIERVQINVVKWRRLGPGGDSEQGGGVVGDRR